MPQTGDLRSITVQQFTYGRSVWCPRFRVFWHVGQANRTFHAPPTRTAHGVPALAGQTRVSPWISQCMEPPLKGTLLPAKAGTPCAADENRWIERKKGRPEGRPLK